MPKRKITVYSHKHSFTLYPSLSPYRQTDRQTDRETNTLAAHGLEEPIFQLCCMLCQFLVLVEKGFGLHTHVLSVQYSCGVVLVFSVRREIVFGVTYILSVQYSCCAVVSIFLVVAGNSSQNEDTFLQKNLIGLLYHTVTIVSQKYRKISVQLENSK
jgi:hypothetical protein